MCKCLCILLRVHASNVQNYHFGLQSVTLLKCLFLSHYVLGCIDVVIDIPGLLSWLWIPLMSSILRFHNCNSAKGPVCKKIFTKCCAHCCSSWLVLLYAMGCMVIVSISKLMRGVKGVIAHTLCTMPLRYSAAAVNDSVLDSCSIFVRASPDSFVLVILYVQCRLPQTEKLYCLIVQEKYQHLGPNEQHCVAMHPEFACSSARGMSQGFEALPVQQYKTFLQTTRQEPRKALGHRNLCVNLQRLGCTSISAQQDTSP